MICSLKSFASAWGKIRTFRSIIVPSGIHTPLPITFNPLDKTSIHPESYDATIRLLNSLSFDVASIGSDELKNALKDIDIDKKSKELDIDKYTLEDIVKSLISPERDPRDDMPKPILKSDVLHN